MLAALSGKDLQVTNESANFGEEGFGEREHLKTSGH
jgi:hypothetical protein